jgi:mevalonate kinase
MKDETETETGPPVSACTPAKVILGGEHLVLYGAPAVAVPVFERRLVLRLMMRPGPRLTLPEPLNGAAEAVSELLGGRLLGFARLHISSDIPQRAGLGSSAALAVALGRALVAAAARTDAGDMIDGPLERPSEESLARAVAAVIEGEIHGRASGLDTTVVAAGRPIRFDAGPPASAREIRLASPLDLLLVDTRVRRSTSEQIARVAEQRDRRPGVFEQTALAGRSATELLCAGLEQGDPALISEAVFTLGHMLRGLGLEPEEAGAIREALSGIGVALKITGAGGGGFLLAHAQQPEILLEAERALACDWPVIRTHLEPTPAQASGSGVRP